MKSKKRKNNQKVTLSIDTITYREYKNFCEKNALMLSKKVELFMKKELEKTNK